MKLSAQRVLPFAFLLLALAASLPAWAQEDEEGRFALGIGGGMVQTGGESDPYFTGSLRMRVGYRSAGEERRGSVFGFVEPEVGYRTRSTSTSLGNLDVKDTLVGVNVGGAVRLRVFEYFVAGGVGYHFIDRDALQGGAIRSASDNNIGVNVQFGADVRFNDTFAVFVVGRSDLVQESEENRNLNEEQQTKVYLGVRLHL
jgi:hypothetical protein